MNLDEIQRIKKAIAKNERRYKAAKPCCQEHSSSKDGVGECYAIRAGRLIKRLESEGIKS